MIRPSETSVLLVAHGSRLEQANDEVRSLARKLSEGLRVPVIACFLELAAPSIPEAIDLAARTGTRRVKILPYFLAQGRHVQRDIPSILQEKREQYPDISIEMLDYLGAHPLLFEVLSKTLKD